MTNEIDKLLRNPTTSMTIFILFFVLTFSLICTENIFGQKNNNSFVLFNDSNTIPSPREMILTDEIDALAVDIDFIKNASASGDYEAIYNKTLEVISGPNWGNISADLLYRKEFVPLNNFVSNLQSINSLTKDSNLNTKVVNDEIVKESNALVTNYGNILDSLAVPIFDVTKIITNVVIPSAIVIIFILAIPKIRRRFKIKY
jgi:beta-galactosidase GanA